jgi:hypothetical protein
MKQKKAFSAVMIVALLLLIIVGAIVSLNIWFNNFNSDLIAKYGVKSKDKIEISSIKIYDFERTLITLKKYSEGYEVINKLKLNGKECFMYSSNVIEKASYIPTNCSFNLYDTVKIEIFTDNGVYSKTLSILYVE